MSLKDQLLAVADAYARAVGLSRSRVSTIVLNRGATLEAIAEGRADVTTGTFEKALVWFSTRWPADLAWPEGVHRPDPLPSDDAMPPASVAAGPDPQAGTGHPLNAGPSRVPAVCDSDPASSPFDRATGTIDEPGSEPQAGRLSNDAEDLSRVRGDEACAADDLAAAPALSIAEAAE